LGGVVAEEREQFGTFENSRHGHQWPTIDKEIFLEVHPRVIEHGRGKIVILQRIHTDFYKYRQSREKQF
jgi:hypothetical protein